MMTSISTRVENSANKMCFFSVPQVLINTSAVLLDISYRKYLTYIIFRRVYFLHRWKIFIGGDLCACRGVIVVNEIGANINLSPD